MAWPRLAEPWRWHRREVAAAGTPCPQVRHEVSGQEAHQDEAGRDPGPQRAHHAVPRQHRGEGRAGTLVPGCGTGEGRGCPPGPAGTV